MSLLIPEQISILRKKRDELLNSLLIPVNQIDISSMETINKIIGKIDYDTSIDTMSKWLKINNLLTYNEFLKNIDYDTVNVGTKLVISLTKNKETLIKEFTLVDKEFGINSKRLVKKDSPLGFEVLNCHVNDTFTYKENSSKINGKILFIVKDSNKYLKFLRNNENVYETNITNSQRQLLLEEKSRLQNTSCDDSSRMNCINTLLEKANIIEYAGDVIDVGSVFRIHYFDTDEDEKYEFIHKAVTDELEDAFIEKDSILGKEILGLRNNQKFSIQTDKGKREGIVYCLKRTKR